MVWEWRPLRRPGLKADYGKSTLSMNHFFPLDVSSSGVPGHNITKRFPEHADLHEDKAKRARARRPPAEVHQHGR